MTTAIRNRNDGELPQDHFHKIIDNLITDQEIKDILLQPIKEKPSKSEVKMKISMNSHVTPVTTDRTDTCLLSLKSNDILLSLFFLLIAAEARLSL
ncbi:MAG: hypothetical protein WA364_21635 [Candidatus Nitrosopolaris sp.]